MNITQGVGVVTHQSVLVDLAGLWGEHGLHHELVFVLLGRVELEGLETDSNADLVVGVHHTRVRLHTVPAEREKIISNLRAITVWRYLLGAVVFILKQTFLSDGFFNFI